MRLSLGKTKEELKAFAQSYRREIEDGGIDANGMYIATDDRSKTMVLGALVAARSSPQWGTVWQTADGAGIPIGLQEIEMISDLVQTHINAVFLVYSEVAGRIEDDTLVSVAQTRDYFDSLMESFSQPS